MRILAVLFPIFFLYSCSPEKECCLSVDTHVDVVLRNQAGQNMLDSTVHHYFRKDSIKVTYLRKANTGTVIETPGSFVVDQHPNNKQRFLRVFVDNGNSNETTTTLVRLNSIRRDTIQCLIVTSGLSTITEKVWYNGVLRYDVKDHPNGMIWDKVTFGRLIEYVK